MHPLPRFSLLHSSALLRVGRVPVSVISRGFECGQNQVFGVSVSPYLFTQQEKNVKLTKLRNLFFQLHKKMTQRRLLVPAETICFLASVAVLGQSLSYAMRMA